MNTKILAALALLGFALQAPVPPAFAHGPETGPNGGQQVDAGNYHLELVANGTALQLYIRDANDKPVKVDGYKGTAIFVVGGKPQRIPLAPAGGNHLAGTATAPLPAKPKGAVQITTAGGETVQAKY